VPVTQRFEISGDSVTVVDQRYPFAGEDNVLVELHVRYLSDGTSAQIDLGEETDIYLARVN
tara:strand:+ start:1471 stop:1653 length:183 start_codon:yes stop_codon:yes gene_type:complete